MMGGTSGCQVAATPGSCPGRPWRAQAACPRAGQAAVIVSLLVAADGRAARAAVGVTAARLGHFSQTSAPLRDTGNQVAIRTFASCLPSHPALWAEAVWPVATRPFGNDHELTSLRLVVEEADMSSTRASLDVVAWPARHDQRAQSMFRVTDSELAAAGAAAQ
jgi:hypothetical protein